MSREVAVLRWPEQADDVARLAAVRRPRLLLVEPGVDPPESGACEEDWVRLPAADEDIAAHVRAIERRTARHSLLPTIDADGRLHFRERWVPLSPIEQRLGRVLVGAYGCVVQNDALLAAGWPDGPTSSNALRVHLTRFRQRVAPLGLEVRGVRPSRHVLQERVADRHGAAR